MNNKEVRMKEDMMVKGSRKSIKGQRCKRGEEYNGKGNEMGEKREESIMRKNIMQ